MTKQLVLEQEQTLDMGQKLGNAVEGCVVDDDDVVVVDDTGHVKLGADSLNLPNTAPGCVPPKGSVPLSTHDTKSHDRYVPMVVPFFPIKDHLDKNVLYEMHTASDTKGEADAVKFKPVDEEKI